jgi:hypothetical protein
MPNSVEMNVREAAAVVMIRQGMLAGYVTENTLQSEVENLNDGPPFAKEAVLSRCQHLFEEKKAAELSWPEVTDVDRLISAFSSLRKNGMCCYFAEFEDDFDNPRLITIALTDRLDRILTCDDPASLRLPIGNTPTAVCVCPLEGIDVDEHSEVDIRYFLLGDGGQDDWDGLGDRIADELARCGLSAHVDWEAETVRITNVDWKKRGGDRLPFMLDDEFVRLKMHRYLCWECQRADGGLCRAHDM